MKKELMDIRGWKRAQAHKTKQEDVSVHYTGKFKMKGFAVPFHAASDRIPLGQGRVIKGWDEGIALMKVGGTRRNNHPARAAYGER